MNAIRNLVGVTACWSLLLGGCTHLQVERVSQLNGQAADPRVEAAPQTDRIDYNLPKTSIDFTATITLNDCDNLVSVGSAAASEPVLKSSPPVDVTESITASLRTGPDPAQQYSIRVDRTRSWAKQLNLTVVRNPNHTLVSYNGTLTDQAGPTIVTAIGTLVAIGGAVAMPAVAPVEAAAATTINRSRLDAKLVSLRISRKGKTALDTALQNLSLNHEIPETIAARLPDQVTGADKPKVRTAIGAARHKNSAHVAAVRQGAQRPPETTMCRSDVRQALMDIAQLQAVVNKGAKSQPSKEANAAQTGSDSSTSAAPSAKVDPSVMRAQAQIARISKEHGLTKTVTWSLSPTSISLARGKDGALAAPGMPIVVVVNEDLFTDAIAGWFTADGVNTISASAQAKSNATFERLASHIVARLTIQPWTLGRDFVASPDPTNRASGGIIPDGIIYRDPALARLRLCLGTCVEPRVLTAKVAGKPLNANVSIDSDTATLVSSATYVEQTNDLGSQDVPLPQLGRINALSMRSKLFETSIANLALDQSGSVTTIGTQGSNNAAAGVAGLTSAANAASTAMTARNTAVTAGNTALVSQAQIQDQRNTALSHCLQMQQTIVASGGKPEPCQ